MKCPLCKSLLHRVFYHSGAHFFYQCATCYALVRNPATYLSAEKEKDRYLLHNNRADDLQYRRFVAPITQEVLQYQNPTCHIGLDYGAGVSPATVAVLSEHGFDMALYDPYFHPHTQVLQQTYHFIVCCETMEHFYHPKKEFRLLKSLLKPGGRLYCMTDIYRNQAGFNDWYYKNDPTHVFIYTETTIRYIQENIKFNAVEIKDRLIVFKN